MNVEQFEKKLQEQLHKFSSTRFSLFPSFGRKKGEGEVEYATFSGRMLALTVDMLLLMLMLMPLFEWISALVFPDFDRDRVTNEMISTLILLLQQQIEPQAAWQIALASGVVENTLFNYTVQIVITGIIIVAVWHRYATTPGMWLLGMYIADADSGGKPTLKQFVLRYVGVILAMIPLTIGMIWMVFDKRSQGWQDKLANTLVLRKPRRKWWKKKAAEA